MHCNELVKKIFYIVDESKEMLYFFLSKRHLSFYAMDCLLLSESWDDWKEEAWFWREL